MKYLRSAAFIVFLLSGGAAFAAGTCPSGLPVTGANCYFIAANGSDTNSGTSESSPWMHAPGMPQCSGTCVGVTPSPGQGFIFRGGDTWHFGNSGAVPYTGGTWNMNNWWGTQTSCTYEGATSGCIYWGVDQSWYTGSSWKRPILTGDNPTSTSLVASCASQVSGGNDFIHAGVAQYIDNFEMTGLCTKDATDDSGGAYISYGGTGIAGQGMLIEANLYFHGWTATTGSAANNSLSCVVLGGGYNGLQSLVSIVVDGSDSLASACAWGTFPSFYHMKDSIIRYTTQGVGQWCHDIHDNIFEHFYNPYVTTHGNILECNNDSTGDAPNQPANTPNVFYNNIIRHDDPGFGAGGQVHLWFCPETVPEYWFNNLMYDVANENYWDIAGPPIYGCTNSGGQFMFNNTLVDGNQPCNLGPNSTGGKYLTVYNELLINSPYDSSGTGCTGGPASTTNALMSDATAVSQGFFVSSGGSLGGYTCANEATTPCAATLPTDIGVGAGANHQNYCTQLASYTSEYAISTEAANACRYGTTDGCAYVVSTHSMNCPAQVPIARPTAAAWDAGAYQFPTSQTQAPQAASNAQTSVR